MTEQPAALIDGFRHCYTTDVRFRDLDAFGHVNNAVILTYAEAGRVDYLAHVVHDGQLRDLTMLSVILAEITVTFRSPIYFGERVVVATRVVRMGRSSMHMEARITADDREAALARNVLVHYDHTTRHSTPLPDDARARIAAFEDIALQG